MSAKLNKDHKNGHYMKSFINVRSIFIVNLSLYNERLFQYCHRSGFNIITCFQTIKIHAAG